VEKRTGAKDSDIVPSTTAATLIAVIIVTGGATIYFAVRRRQFRKFLAGASFVSAGIQFYLYLAGCRSRS
jgi:multisubunit Na+/H+ antiporter MnhC subunit